MTRIWFAVLIGVGGLAILLWLGTWQVQRLGWKQDLLADIDARIAAEPVPLPTAPDPTSDRYLPVRLTGNFDTGKIARMLASRRHTGAVYRVIAPFNTTSGRVLVDLGWVTSDAKLPELPPEDVTLTGNLDWPREADGFTPDPDLTQNLWYARAVPAMAAAYDTDPVMVVLNTPIPGVTDLTPWPVDTTGIPNDHLQYAITWFSLAVIWAAMTGQFLARSRKQQQES
jgi:surfeit locus 1 family protein